jgi:predicted RNA-binding protein
MVKYWLSLFTPQTWEESQRYEFKVIGFRESRGKIVSKIEPGDFIIAYITKLSRFSGIFKVISKPYKDEEKAKQIWKGDKFPWLVDVQAIIKLDFVHAVPKNEILPQISVGSKWGGIVRGSPASIPNEDGEKIRKILEESKESGLEYPITGKVSKTSRKFSIKSKQEYGIPMHFRGLRHAPLNEQGVVYLFALVAKDLGFTVEAIGTSFPDCEAMRRIDRKGDRWQRVRIEFEYYSSDFKKHGHPVEGCDIIVCWKHDWEDCPIEVIELSDVIKKLGAVFES